MIISKDFRETKIKILSEEHSKSFQEAVFEAGGEWRQSGRFYQKGAKYIFVNKHLSMLYCDDVKFFHEHDYKEIQFPITKGHFSFDSSSLWEFGGKVNIHELTKQDGSSQYTHKAKGGVYTVVTVAKAAGDIRNGGFGPIIVYKNECGDLFSRSLKNFQDFMNPIDGS